MPAEPPRPRRSGESAPYREDDIPNALSGIGVFLLTPINAVGALRLLWRVHPALALAAALAAGYVTLWLGLTFIFMDEDDGDGAP